MGRIVIFDTQGELARALEYYLTIGYPRPSAEDAAIEYVRRRAL